ncbi:MAG: hypothetical protein RLP15_07935 [Cryomorphaceae bacterium]
MRFALFACLIIAISGTIYAQPSTNWGIPMYYHHLLLESPQFQNVDYDYYPGSSNSTTRLYPPELNKVTEAFLAHIERQRIVESYTGPLGPAIPSSYGDIAMASFLEMRSVGSLARLGRYYIDLSVKEKIAQKEGGVYRDDQAFIVDGDILRGVDTVYTQDLATGEMYAETVELKSDFLENAVGLGFTELWSYDKKKAAFHKEVKYLSLDESVFYEDTYRGLRALFNFKTAKFNKKYLGSDGLVRKGMESTTLFDRDFRVDDECYVEGMAKSPHAAGYIEPSDRIEMIMDIVEGVKSGQLTIYHYNFIDFDIAKAEKASVAEFFEAQRLVDTVYVENLIDGTLEEVEVVEDLLLEDVVGFQFFEDWFIDADNFSMYKRVNGMVMLTLALDEIGEVKGIKPFAPFYIKFSPKM